MVRTHRGCQESPTAGGRSTWRRARASVPPLLAVAAAPPLATARRGFQAEGDVRAAERAGVAVADGLPLGVGAAPLDEEDARAPLEAVHYHSRRRCAGCLCRRAAAALARVV